MQLMTRFLSASLVLAICLVITGCGKDPKKNPDFNEKSLNEPAGIKMGGDARQAPPGP
ncbi:MAG: hypothetical protein WCI02_01045 [Planctomycetota bacterium]|jgi:hypothetical protein